MRRISCQKLARLASGTATANAFVSSIAVDSRQVERGSLFIALQGEMVNGHDYVTDAFERGASAAMVAKSHLARLRGRLGKEERPLIVVDDPRTALWQMAKGYVEEHKNIVKIGITGSCGKTTTKEMLASILSEMGPTAKTPGNFNSDIGLPISLFEIDKESEYGVFEMGIDRVGEMDRHLSLWKPEIALITNIGLSHIGKLGTTDVIAKEKSKIFSPSLERAYMVENSPYISRISEWRGHSINQYGLSSTKGVGQIISLGLQGWLIEVGPEQAHLKAVGKHNLINALGAISVAQDLGGNPAQICAGLENFTPVEGRSKVVNGSVTVIEDWYNSSVDSTTSILDYMVSLPWQGRKLAVLGSMKELGDMSEEAHLHIAHKLLAAKFDDVFLFGKEMSSAWSEIKRLGGKDHFFYTNDWEALQKKMLEGTSRGDLVLLKGSRSMAMERLVPALTSIA
ncbi:MAG: UDP-N-acetylmuramoyl-tripeptide--D-alanyl-D-alanine ligase [Sphaerochaetaceae bacterium]